MGDLSEGADLGLILSMSRFARVTCQEGLRLLDRRMHARGACAAMMTCFPGLPCGGKGCQDSNRREHVQQLML